MQATFKLFVSCLFCLSLALVSGCGNTDGTFTGSSKSTASEKPPTLTPAEQAEVDRFMTFGRDAILRYLESALNDRNRNDDIVLKYLKYFVSQGADVNAKGYYNTTPLHLAVQSGNVEIFKFLVANGADVNADGNDKLLYMAKKNGNNEIFNFLVSKGADVNAALFLAVRDMDYALTEFFVSKGANVNTKSLFGITPLHLVAEGQHAGRETLTRFSNFLISKGANVNAKDNDGKTPLHYAATKPQTTIVQLLISNGADVNAKNNRGETPADLAREFLRSGAARSANYATYTNEILAILEGRSR